MGWLSFPAIPRLAGRALRPLAGLCVLGLGGAAALHWLVLVPAEERIRLAEEAYGEARSQAVVLARSRVTQERIRDLEQRLEQLWATLPAEQEFASLAIEVSRSARAVGVALPGMTHSHKKPKDGLPPKAALVFQASGTYQDIYRFIHKLETMKPYLVIEQLDAARASETSARRRGAVQFNIRLVTFLKTDGAPPGSS